MSQGIDGGIEGSSLRGCPLSQVEGASRLLIGNTYRLIRCIGRGSMGEVFEAEHTRLKHLVAIKFLRRGAAEDKRSERRFWREIRALAAIRSDHVVAVLDCGELDDHTPYFVMERLIGSDLRQLLSRIGPLPVARAVRLLSQAGVGLRLVHASGYTHRDLKPANLFVATNACGEDCCKILDFGVVKASTADVTSHGAVVGTVRYMAPEQLADASAASPLSDVYALGAILYECLTGAPANEGTTVQEVMFYVLHRTPRAIDASRHVPLELEQAIMRSLSADPTKRTRSVDAFLSEISPFTGPPSASVHLGLETLHEQTRDTADTEQRLTTPLRRCLSSVATLGLGLVAGLAANYRIVPEPESEVRRQIQSIAEQESSKPVLDMQAGYESPLKDLLTRPASGTSGLQPPESGGAVPRKAERELARPTRASPARPSAVPLTPEPFYELTNPYSEGR